MGSAYRWVLVADAEESGRGFAWQEKIFRKKWPGISAWVLAYAPLMPQHTSADTISAPEPPQPKKLGQQLREDSELGTLNLEKRPHLFFHRSSSLLKDRGPRISRRDLDHG